MAALASTATIILTPTADSYAVLYSPASNFGSADLHVEYYPLDGPNFTRSLMQFSMADLAYQLPVAATDSDGQKTTASITVSVHYHLYLPLVRR